VSICLMGDFHLEAYSISSNEELYNSKDKYGNGKKEALGTTRVYFCFIPR